MSFSFLKVTYAQDFVYTTIYILRSLLFIHKMFYWLYLSIVHMSRGHKHYDDSMIKIYQYVQEENFKFRIRLACQLDALAHILDCVDVCL